MADFNWYLNRQGIQGVQGPKGDQGFSPVIEVDTDTASEYKLKIITETGEFVTDNLRGDSVTDLGGTYVRFNQETKTMSAANPDFATDVLYGVVRLANDEDIEYGTADRVVTADRLLTINSTLTTMQTEIDEISQDIPDISGLATKIELSTAVTSLTQADTALDNRITQVAGMIPDTSDFLTSEDVAAVALSGSYNDLTNTPTIPTVNDGQLTITQGGNTLGMFTANQSGNVTIDLPASSAPNNGTLSINVNGTNVGAFSANQAGNTTVDITTATQLSDLTDGTTVVTQSTFTTEITELSQDIGGVEARVNLIEENGLTANDITQTISSTGTTQVTSSAAVYNALQNVQVDKATSTTLGTVMPDNSTITVDNNGVISAVSSAPTNMVTTDTAQDITGVKTFTGYDSNGGIHFSYSTSVRAGGYIYANPTGAGGLIAQVSSRNGYRLSVPGNNGKTIFSVGNQTTYGGADYRWGVFQSANDTGMYTILTPSPVFGVDGAALMYGSWAGHSGFLAENAALLVQLNDVRFHPQGASTKTVSLLPSSILSDSTTTATSTWTSNKINTEVSSKSGVVIKRYTEVSE